MGGADDAHEAVVSIVTPEGDARPQACSGVLIAPRVVLTAGHCTIARSPSGLVVGVGPSARMPTRTLAIASVQTPTRYTATRVDNQQGLDVGVIILAENAPMAPIAIARTAPPASATAIGFGLRTADAQSGATRSAATVTIAATCTTLLTFGDLTTNACHGDSGGPLIARTADGAEAVFGVVSYGRTEACDPPSYAVRVDAYASFLDQVMAGVPSDACPSCPSPGMDCRASAADAGAEGGEPPASREPLDDDRGCALGGRPPSAWLLLTALFIAYARVRRGGRPFKFRTFSG